MTTEQDQHVKSLEDNSPSFWGALTRKNIQSYSGAIFSSFLGLHVTTTLSANYGPLAYNEALGFFRIFYQNPLIEPILLGSLLVHIAAGITDLYGRFFPKIKDSKGHSNGNTNGHTNGNSVTAKTDLTPWPLRLHRYSAVVLSAFIGGHVLATRIVPYFINEPLTFAHMSFTLNLLPALFYPYYIVFGIAGFYHMCYGWLQILRKTQYSRSLWFKIAIGVVSVLIFSAVHNFKYHPLGDSPPGTWHQIASYYPLSLVVDALGKKY